MAGIELPWMALYAIFDRGLQVIGPRRPKESKDIVSETVVLNELLEQRDAGPDLVQRHELIRLMRLIDRTGSHDNGFHAELLHKRRLSGKGDSDGIVTSEFFSQVYQLTVGGLLKRRDILDQ